MKTLSLEEILKLPKGTYFLVHYDEKPMYVRKPRNKYAFPVTRETAINLNAALYESKRPFRTGICTFAVVIELR